VLVCAGIFVLGIVFREHLDTFWCNVFSDFLLAVICLLQVLQACQLYSICSSSDFFSGLKTVLVKNFGLKAILNFVPRN
jgi:hypothetical protein